MHKTKKAQIGNEFLFGIGIVLLIFIIMIPVSIDKRKEIRETAEFLEKKDDCKTFVNVLARVATTENLNITFSSKNNISTLANSKIVDAGGVLCNSVVNLSSSMNLQKGEIEIRNSNLEVIIKNV